MVKKNPLMSTQKIAEHSRISTITKNKEAILIRSPDLAIFVLLDRRSELIAFTLCACAGYLWLQLCKCTT